MPFDWSCGALAEGLRCYRCEQFFEAHEHWEAVWLGCDEPEKTFLQSLIQISAAFHHLQRGNHPGAISLLTRALHRLDRYPSAFAGVAVESLRQSLRAWLTVLSANDGRSSPRYPQIP